MTFLNTLMLGGVLAFTVPLVIHLLHRSRYRVVPWGAMHLLESLVRVNRRRFRVEQLILLAIRCAIPAVLALCMAQPVLTGWRATSGNVPSALVALLDDSYSMQAQAGRDSTSRSNATRAVAEAREVIQRRPLGSEVSVIAMGRPASLSDQLAYDTADLERQLERHPFEQGPIRAAGAFAAAASTLNQSVLARTNVVVFSDFQRADWLGPNAPQPQRLRELLNTAKVPPAVTLWKLDVASTDNVCVETVEVSHELAGINQPLRVRARLRNHGRRNYDDLRVHFRADGAAQEVTQIPLAPGADATVLFRCTFAEPGSHLVEVTVDADDLAADNQRAATLSVVDRIGVLVVNGASDPQLLRGETDFLQIALQPFAGAGDKLADLIQARILEPPQFDRAALEGVRVVILANVAQLTDLQLTALEQFVHGGGGLLVFAGDRLDLDWYDRVFTQGPTAILPMRYAALAGKPADPAAQATIISERFQHPALQHFNDRRNGNLADGRISMWYRCTPAAMQDQDRSRTVREMMKLSVGDPLMMERQCGDGCVIQVATACDADWSNLPMRPFYLPLMQQLVLHLASTWDPPRNVELGQPLLAALPADSPPEVTLTEPTGTSRSIRCESRDGRPVARFDAAERPGVYQLAKETSRPIHFVVSVPRSESELETLTDDQTHDLAENLGGTVVRSLAEYQQLDSLRRHGRPVWKWLLWCVVGLLLAELLVARWCSRETS
jgi:hypothetical protein